MTKWRNELHVIFDVLRNLIHQVHRRCGAVPPRWDSIPMGWQRAAPVRNKSPGEVWPNLIEFRYHIFFCLQLLCSEHIVNVRILSPYLCTNYQYLIDSDCLFCIQNDSLPQCLLLFHYCVCVCALIVKKVSSFVSSHCCHSRSQLSTWKSTAQRLGKIGRPCQ